MRMLTAPATAACDGSHGGPANWPPSFCRLDCCGWHSTQRVQIEHAPVRASWLRRVPLAHRSSRPINRLCLAKRRSNKPLRRRQQNALHLESKYACSPTQVVLLKVANPFALSPPFSAAASPLPSPLLPWSQPCRALCFFFRIQTGVTQYTQTQIDRRGADRARLARKGVCRSPSSSGLFVGREQLGWFLAAETISVCAGLGVHQTNAYHVAPAPAGPPSVGDSCMLTPRLLDS